MDFFEERDFSFQQQVPAIVRNIYQSLVSYVPVDASQQTDIVRLAEEDPIDVVLTLLCCAPSCDRFAVQAMKSLFCRLRCDNVVMEMGRKCGWETLLRADTQHYAVGLLARCLRGKTVGLAGPWPSQDFSFAGAFKARLRYLVTWSFSEASPILLTSVLKASRLKVPLRQDSIMAGRFLNLFKVFRRNRNTDRGAAPAEQPEELEQFQPLQDDAAMDKRQEQEPAQGRFRKTLKRFRKFLRIRRSQPATGVAELEVSQDPVPLQATSTGPPQPLRPAECDGTVPAIVRNIYQSLVSHVLVDASQQTDLVRLAEEDPTDVVLTLLRCAPSCDRAAAVMWQAIASSGQAVKRVVPILLCVMENWPLCNICTSDGDNKDVFSLSATLVLWVMVQMPQCHEAMVIYTPRIFAALLFQVVITTQQMPPEEFDSFWRACQEEHHLPSNPNSFAVQAMKALLCRLGCSKEVMAMERKGGWDTLLCADTQHNAVGLLAREMCHGLAPFCTRIAIHLLKALARDKPPWDLSSLAFLVEVLEYLDLTTYGDGVLEMVSRHLQSECRQRRRLALRGLVVLSKDPSMAIRMCSLSQRLQDLLGDADGNVVVMTLRVFINMLKNKDIVVCSTTAPKLAQALMLLFDHGHSHVQLLSLDLFFMTMGLVVDEGKKPLEKILNQSLLPLFIHCHDENWRVAKASQQTLLRVADFLKRRNLKQLLRKEQLWEFADCLVRTAWRSPNLRSSLPPVLSVWSWQLWPSAAPMGDSLCPTHRSLPWAARLLLQAPVAPSRVPMEPQPCGAAGLGGSAAPRAAAGPLPPPEPGASGCCPVLDCLDLTKYSDYVLEIVSRHLQSECRQRRRLALRGLVVISKDPSMDLLGDADGDVVSMTLQVFMNMLQKKEILVSSTTGPKMAEALLALFDNDNSHVRLLSINLFCKVIELVVDEGKKPLKTIVNKSLYSLLIYSHDENRHVAKASWEALLCVAKFLQWKNLEQLLKKEQPLKFKECL
ncbi:uncharacterized protein LOC111941996, partial [Cyanistes caeruleus]|uniref:uncharacterized protein LOC111941996 n=1 Tax=Cyanistes caeruleus TaxID=156563 RepID=UPI000CDB5B4A